MRSVGVFAAVLTVAIASAGVASGADVSDQPQALQAKMYVSPITPDVSGSGVAVPVGRSAQVRVILRNELPIPVADVTVRLVPTEPFEILTEPVLHFDSLRTGPTRVSWHVCSDEVVETSAVVNVEGVSDRAFAIDSPPFTLAAVESPRRAGCR